MNIRILFLFIYLSFFDNVTSRPAPPCSSSDCAGCLDVENTNYLCRWCVSPGTMRGVCQQQTQVRNSRNKTKPSRVCFTRVKLCSQPEPGLHDNGGRRGGLCSNKLGRLSTKSIATIFAPGNDNEPKWNGNGNAWRRRREFRYS